MSLFPSALLSKAVLLIGAAGEKRLRIAAAESCTGGLLTALLTEIPGSSAVVERGFVTYSNEAKRELLGVPGDVLADYGAVSEPVARMMAEGALAASRANIAVSITGVAGPGGGTPMKPVGTVHFACAREGLPIQHFREDFGPLSRADIRLASVGTALDMLLQAVEAR